MTEADIIGKLSRIFETHAFAGEDADFDLDDLLDDFNSPEFSSSMRGGPFAATAASPYRHNQSPERDFGIQNSR